MFDEDILDENNEVNDINFQSKRGGRTVQKVTQPKNQSAFDYGDLEFSEEDNGKKLGGMRNSSLHKPGKFEDSLSSLVMQQKQEQQQQQPASRLLSALPPIQQNNNSSMLTAKAKQSQKSSKILDEEYDGKLARINTGKKKEEPKKKQDDEEFDDLDDLDDIYAQNQKESQIKKQGKSIHSSSELPTLKQKPIEEEEEKREQKQEENESDNYEDDYEKDDFDQDDKHDIQQQQKDHSDKKSELSDLSELKYEQKQPKKVENNESSNRKEPHRQKEGSAPTQRRQSGQNIHDNYGNNQYKEKNSKPPQQPSSARTNSQSQNRQRIHNNSQQKKLSLLNISNLEDLLVERQYDSMSLHQIKAENEQLREKLREFNQQLSDKIDHSQAFISQQASQQGSDKYHRSRSSQMRTADAETENDNKIMKRLREELERLQQRLRVLEDPSYMSTLKLQIETSKSLINKFKLQVKQTSFKNDQQSKELERISQEGGVHESVREGYILKQDVQFSMEKLYEMQNKKEELDDLFKRKNDLLQVKEEEYNKKHDEALALGVNMNFSSAEVKKREKYLELLKNLEQWEKSNETLAKMNKTREGAMLKELDSVLKFIQEKDSQINEVENEIIASQGAVQDRVDNEKLYSKNVKELLGRLDNAENHSLHNEDSHFKENSSSIESTAHKPSVNNLLSPRPLKISSKPNLKFTKIENGSPSPAQKKIIQNEVALMPSESEKGINFHKKIQNRQDVSSDREEQPTGVSSKPFSLKKGKETEQRVWKPQEEDDNNNKVSTEQTNKENITSGPAKSFNFKHKNDVLNSDASQNAPQQYLLPQKLLNSEEQSESSENSSFSKPPMFKFKKTETIMEKNNSNNNSDIQKMTDSQPSQDQLLQQPKQQQVSSLLADDNDDIGFSMNSRISKNRIAKGKNQQSEPQFQVQSNPMQTKLSNILEEDKQNTQSHGAYKGIEQNKELVSGGYQFSAMNEQPSGVPRRRGQKDEKNSISDLIGGGYQPSSNANKPTQNIGQDLNIEKKEDAVADDDFGNNIKSRRGRNHQIKKNQDETELNLFGVNDNIKPFVPKVAQVDNKLNSDNAQKKQPDNEWDFGSLANPTVAPSKAGLNNNANGNLSNFEEKQSEAPKTFNFKRNQQANAISPDKPQESQPIKTEYNNDTVQKEVPSSNIERNRGGAQGNQVKPEIQKKDDDDVLFMGPSERRRVKKPNVQDQGANPKTIKRDVFQDNDNNKDQPFNFAAPKEVGTTSTNQPQDRLQPKRIAEDSGFGKQKKSALDDDLDGEDGLEFLKEKKQKINYNDDDDDIFGAKPQKVQQAAPAIQKKIQDQPQGREKKIISNEDFFNDLM